MPIIHYPVEEIEDVPTDHRRKSHATPICAQTMYTECFGDKGRETSKEESVRETSKPRDKTKEVRVLDIEGCDLGAEKD
jgi:hypothetical protein